MSTTELQAVPVGTWSVDKIHSDVAFAIDYMAGTFTGSFSDFDAELNDGDNAGLVRVKQATLGGNCGGLSGNFTYTARRLCLGRRNCDIAIDPRLLEDRVRGCDKNLVVRWSCTPIAAERVSTESNVTAADRLTLSCGP